MTISEALALTLQYGLPLIMFFGVIWLSNAGIIVWKPTLDAYKERLIDVVSERDRLMGITLPAVKAVEHGAEALAGKR